MVWLCLLWCVGLRSWLKTYARTTRELLATIEEIAIGGVHLMLTSTYIMFNHTIHHGIEVANPSKLNSTIDILLGAYIVIKRRLHQTRLNALTLKLWGNAEDDGEDAVTLLPYLQVPHKAQLID